MEHATSVASAVTIYILGRVYTVYIALLGYHALRTLSCAFGRLRF